MQLEGVDLTLAVGAGLDRPGGTDQIAYVGKRVGTKLLADVDDGQARKGDALRVDDDEVRIAVAIGIDPLDVGDPPLGGAATGQLGWAP